MSHPARMQPTACLECFGTRAIPDDIGLYDDGYAPCPLCVVDGGDTFVVWD